MPRAAAATRLAAIRVLPWCRRLASLCTLSRPRSNWSAHFHSQCVSERRVNYSRALNLAPEKNEQIFAPLSHNARPRRFQPRPTRRIAGPASRGVSLLRRLLPDEGQGDCGTGWFAGWRFAQAATSS